METPLCIRFVFVHKSHILLDFSFWHYPLSTILAYRFNLFSFSYEIFRDEANYRGKLEIRNMCSGNYVRISIVTWSSEFFLFSKRHCLCMAFKENWNSHLVSFRFSMKNFHSNAISSMLATFWILDGWMLVYFNSVRRRLVPPAFKHLTHSSNDINKKPIYPFGVGIPLTKKAN